MPRTAIPVRSRAHVIASGNGTPEPEPDRLIRIEALLQAIEKRLDVQFQRIAEMQVQLDRLAATQSKAANAFATANPTG